MSAEAIRQQQVQVRQHIDVELDPVARSIASLRHNSDTTSLPQDILFVTEKHIRQLFEKYGTIDVVVISTPCQDLSSANVNDTSLAGSDSKLLWDALRILDIVKIRNPHVKYIVENV
jgi:site-specific DNA-cytosine methylase